MYSSTSSGPSVINPEVEDGSASPDMAEFGFKWNPESKKA